MPEQMPLALLFAYSLLLGFINTHQRHARNFMGASQSFALALNFSAFMGSLCLLALFGFYLYTTTWYWPFILFAAAALVGGFGFAFLDVKIGQPWMSLIAFLWPLVALWVFNIVDGLPS